MAAEAATASTVTLRKPSRSLDIRAEDIYATLLLYARKIWPQKTIVSDGGVQDGVNLSSKAKAFGNVQLRGVKYGMTSHHRGKGYCYNFIEGRVPCKIQYLLGIQLSSDETKLVALVERFEGRNPADEVWKDGVKAVPWHDWSVDLGISLWDTRTEQLEAVAMEDLSGRFSWGDICLEIGLVRVVFSWDHTGQEPEPLDDDD
ncbi:hypothetical protein DFH07DRAFT_966505 [Mycena maculata]|uniref:Uncharacterized protein n=1 Tax=Mycena maculata TaxID=230809 RepID=A0AAD7MYD1_9AGAR|nr:hypothetical protein DFH07DRAFT_966505 [Mycena maculata]